MKPALRQALAVLAMLLPALPVAAANDEFSFGVIPLETRTTPNDDALRKAIAEADADNLAFVVVNGIKAADEACTDAAYQRRKSLLQTAKHGLIVSLAGTDWANCKSSNGKLAAAGRLNRLRELFFIDEFSLGATRLPLVRQSTSIKFRNFAENARWEIDKLMFATINLPSGNNHYVSAAGRNSEFEDRLVANRDWLNRIFLYADQDKMAAIVLFSDGNPLVRGGPGKRDGYAETRRIITRLAAKFSGKVLIVHGQPAKRSQPPAIRWQGNLGEVGVAERWLKLRAKPGNPNLFFVENNGDRQTMPDATGTVKRQPPVATAVY